MDSGCVYFAYIHNIFHLSKTKTFIKVKEVRTMDIQLSIIIVNWNSRNLLKKCIDSIRQNLRGIDYECIVIDSGSFDGCRDMLEACFPEVHFIQCWYNIGFARANNVASNTARGDYILFLNPDTEIEGRSINVLLSGLVSMPHAGAAGAKLLNSDRSVQTNCIRKLPTILNQTLGTETLEGRFPCSRLWETRALRNGVTKPTEVEAVSGACMIVRRSVFEKIGRFCNDYFMYSEDMDLCLKMRSAGYKIFYIPDAVVVHHRGKSSAQRATNCFADVMMLESRWRFFKNTRNLGYAFRYRYIMLLSSALRIVLLSISWPVLILHGKVDLVMSVRKKWMTRLRWTLGLEGWVKNY